MLCNSQKIIHVLSLSLFVPILGCGNSTSPSAVVAPESRDEHYLSSTNSVGQDSGRLAFSDSNYNVVQSFALDPLERKQRLTLPDGMKGAKLASLRGGALLVAFTDKQLAIQKDDGFQAVKELGLFADIEGVISNGASYLAVTDKGGGIQLFEFDASGNVLVNWVGGSIIIQDSKSVPFAQGVFVGERSIAFTAGDTLIVASIADSLGQQKLVYKSFPLPKKALVQSMMPASTNDSCHAVAITYTDAIFTLDTDSGAQIDTRAFEGRTPLSRGYLPRTHFVMPPKDQSATSFSRPQVVIWLVEEDGKVTDQIIYPKDLSVTSWTGETYHDGSTIMLLQRPTTWGQDYSFQRLRIQDSLLIANRSIAGKRVRRVMVAGSRILVEGTSLFGYVWRDDLGRDENKVTFEAYNHDLLVH